jgi:hypothetical protein
VLEACVVLAAAPTPELGRKLSEARIVRLLRSGGRQRGLERRADEISEALRSPQLEAPAVVAGAYGEVVRSLAGVIEGLTRQIERLQGELSARFEVHPDAEIILSLPGLGSVLGARALGEFGDDPNRYADAKARRCYAGTAPITKASGTRLVVLARVARNRRLADACYLWAFASLGASPGARRCYDAHRAKGKTHHQALRALGNRLVGILDGCLRHRQLYREDIAWPTSVEVAA